MSQLLPSHTMSSVEEIMAKIVAYAENFHGCNQCEYQATTKHNLSIHKQTKHNAI